MISGVLGGLGVLSNFLANQQNADYNRQALDFQKYQYEDSKRYNSAPAVVQRLRAAGINPALAFAGGQTGMAHASSVAPPATIPMRGLDMAGLSAMANSIDLNKSKRDLSNQERALLNARTTAQEFENRMNLLFGEQAKKADIQRAISDAVLNYQNALLAKERGNTERTQQSLNRAAEALKYAMKDLTEEQRNKIVKELEWYDDFAVADIDLKEAQTASNLADVPLKKSQEANNYASAENQRAQAALSRFEKSFREAKAPSDIAKAASEAVIAFNQEGITGWQVKAAEYAAEKAKVEASWAEAYAWKDFILSCINDVAVSVWNAFTAFKNSKSWQNMSQTQQKRMEAEVQKMADDVNTETSTTTWTHSNGRMRPQTSVVTHKRVRK